MKKILITTGGSGGHVIPSLSMYDALKDKYEAKHKGSDIYPPVLIKILKLFNFKYL